MVEIPDGVTVRIDGQTIVIKGPLGEIQKKFVQSVSLKISGKNLELSCNSKALCFTWESILHSMLFGVTKGYKRNLKFVYAHFPISLEVKGKEVIIKNFLGEKQSRKTVLIGNTKIESKGQSVMVSGTDKEAVGQTIANLRAAMRIRDRDARVFQDGIYDIQAE